MQHGVIGGSPEQPTVGFTMQFLESFRQLHRVCPRLTISGVATALQHIHQVCLIHFFLLHRIIILGLQTPPRQHFVNQLRSAYDAYLEIRRAVLELTVTALGRTDRQRVSSLLCPACFYFLKEDAELDPKALTTIDGNNSLKWIDTLYQAGKTRLDDRVLTDPRWIEDAEVDTYKDEVKSSTKVCIFSFLLSNIIRNYYS